MNWKFWKNKCEHNWMFIRNIYGDEINLCGGNRSIWKCIKCGKIEYRESLNYSLKETLNKLCIEYKNKEKEKLGEIYNKWIDNHKSTIDSMIEKMKKDAEEGFYSSTFILTCEEKNNDVYNYKKFFENSDYDLNIYIELIEEKKVFGELNKYKFILSWN